MQQMQPGAVNAGEQAAVRKGPWTIEELEDNILVSYVATHGEGSWNTLARAAGSYACTHSHPSPIGNHFGILLSRACCLFWGRRVVSCAGLSQTGKSCRLRWLNYLRPDLRRGSFTMEEQELIVRLHARWGNKSSRIAKTLPAGRTDNEVKNLWRTKIQKKRSSRDSNEERSAVGSIIADGGTSKVDSKSTPAPEIAEGQGSCNSGQTAGVTCHDNGVLEQKPASLDSHQGSDDHAGGDASVGGAMNCFFTPEFLAAAENFWAIGEFWSMVQSFQGNT
ncbi:hypothetical protein HU200_026448 [Digitaria exilis]|uniref:Uncharacterized protein n=1 Tax=Digitaria exilis TaxID=1010633 RepID=A0A835C728_9POAL|nr:hypothetical protein HU200_026448 [Digitaria exilis]